MSNEYLDWRKGMKEDYPCPDCKGAVNNQENSVDCRTCSNVGYLIPEDEEEASIIKSVDETLKALEESKIKDIEILNKEENPIPPPQTS